MTVLVAVLSGILAFIGAIVGHFVAFDLSTSAKRRDVRRHQAERLGELISEDVAWVSNYRNDMLFGTADVPRDMPPHDRAYAIYALYFSSELADQMTRLLEARHAEIFAIDTARLGRIQRASANNGPLAKESPTQDEMLSVKDLHPPYYKATLDTLAAVSNIVQNTLPIHSELGLLLKRGREILWRTPTPRN